jgi:hypothetical protein
MAGGAVGAETGEDVPGGERGELPERPDPETAEKVGHLGPL